LVHATLRQFRAHLDEVLLAALANALVNCTGIESFHVGLAHHGRSHSFPNVDVSRTVGWFSTEIPLLLDVASARSLSDMVDIVKRQVRSVPNNGIGYGVLRYINKESRLLNLPKPSIRLNNQGNFIEGIPQELFHVISVTSKMEYKKGIREGIMNIGANFRGDCLTTEWSYDRDAYGEEHVQILAENVTAALRLLINS
jgi:non-ribosomal peptide synthase protein (TIGR01720 family)